MKTIIYSILAIATIITGIAYYSLQMRSEAIDRTSKEEQQRYDKMLEEIKQGRQQNWECVGDCKG